MKRKLEQVELEEVELELLELEQVELEVELEEGNSWPGPDIARAGSGSKSGGKGLHCKKHFSIATSNNNNKGGPSKLQSGLFNWPK